MKEQLQQLNMGDFSDSEVAQCQTLLAAIDPAQLPASFGFGTEVSAEQGMQVLIEIIEISPADSLSSLIAELLLHVNNADPGKAAEQKGWLSHLTGKALENATHYLVARQCIERVLEKMHTASNKLECLLEEIDRQREQMRKEVVALRLYIAATRLYLNQAPTAITPTDLFDNPTERLARRLTNLVALYNSHEMTLVQMDQLKAQTTSLLDRYYETSQVLVPIWRAHALSLVTSRQKWLYVDRSG